MIKKTACNLMLLILSTFILSGCGGAKEEKSETIEKVPPKPIIKKLALPAGLTQEEVKQMLGEPNGNISISNKITLLYKGGMIDFIDGKLVAPAPDIVARLNLIYEERQKAANAEVEAVAEPQKKESDSFIGKIKEWITEQIDSITSARENLAK